MKLQLENINASFGHINALSSVSLSARMGEITCIVGPNGAGKSTIAAIASGVIRPKSGKIHIDGHVQIHAKAETIARLGVSMVPEGRRIFSTLTVAENLKLSRGVALSRGISSSEFQVETDRALERFPILRERLSLYAGALSGGEQQQLALSRALLTFPSLLIIDEPSLGLAPKIVEQVYSHLIDINKQYGLTLLVIEQSANRVLEVADVIVVMRNGRVQLNKPRSEISGAQELENAFFGFDTSESPQHQKGS